MPSHDAAAALQRFVEHVIATAQVGLTYATDQYDRQRYSMLQKGASEVLGLLSGIAHDAALRWIQLDEHYATPKVDVRAVIVRDDQVLLVRERADGKWTLPGGWADINESPRECVEREVLEEACLVVTARKLLALLDKHKHDHPPQIPHAYKCFFLCDVIRSAPGGPMLETSAVDYFKVGNLPALSLDRVTPAQIKAMHELAMSPDAPTLFD